MSKNNALWKDLLRKGTKTLKEELEKEKAQEEETSEEAPEEVMGVPTEEATAEPAAEGTPKQIPEEADEELPVAPQPENQDEPLSLEEAVASDTIPEIAPYHERYYLRYCGGARTEELDLEGTKNFLQDLGFDGGELRQAREGKDRAENFRSADSGNARGRRCQRQNAVPPHRW